MTLLAGAPMSAFAQAHPLSLSAIICISSMTHTSTSTLAFIISIVELMCVDSSSIISSSPVISEALMPLALKLSYPSSASSLSGAR